MKTGTILSLILMFVLSGCVTTKKHKNLQLTKSEIRELCSAENLTLSDSLRARLVADSNELRLTPEELRVLKSTGKVILCGKCGYILDSLEFKKHNDNNMSHDVDSQGFVKGSLRDRIIGPYID